MNIESAVAEPGSPSSPAGKDALTRAQKAAVIITALPPEEAGSLLSQLGEKHIKAYVKATKQLQRIPALLLERVIVEFLDSMSDGNLNIGPDSAQEILSRIMSPEAVSSVINEATGVKRSVWEEIRDVPKEAIAGFVSREHPRAASIVLSRLPPESAAAVLALLDADTSERIVGLLKDLTDVEKPVLEMIGEVLRAELLGGRNGDRKEPDALVGAIFDNLTESTRDPLMKSLTESSPEFAKAVAKKMFLFDDVSSRIKPRDVPTLTRVVDQNVLKTAIAYARSRNSEVPEFITGNMSRRLAEQLEEEIAEMPAVSPRAGEAAEAELVKALKGLVASGEIQIVNPDEE